MEDFNDCEFDDVLIAPRVSSVNSRSDVDISVSFPNGFILEFPLVASPMRGIVDAKFAVELSKLGGLAFLHRFYDTETEWLNELDIVKGYNFGVSVGLNDNSYIKILNEYNPQIICVDVANGYTQSLGAFCEEVKNHIVKNNLDTMLMSGNVCTSDGVQHLKRYGVDITRYGIGGGGLCSTRNVTGIGVPQVGALFDVFFEDEMIICSDGGIRNSGDFVKSIVAGADFAMAGSLFAQTYESPSENTIFGMASKKLNELKYTQIKSVEGIEKQVEKKHSLKDFVDEFSWGIKSAGTYLNARNLDKIRNNGYFVRTGKNSIKSL